MWSKGVQAICVAAGDGVAGARARKESWGPISKGLLGHASKLPHVLKANDCQYVINVFHFQPDAGRTYLSLNTHCWKWWLANHSSAPPTVHREAVGDILVLKPRRNDRWLYLTSSAFIWINGKWFLVPFTLIFYCRLPYVPEVGLPGGEVIYLRPCSAVELASQVSTPR